MNVLVVNAGSSSLKYQLLDTESREVFAKGNCECIGQDKGIFGHAELGGDKVKEDAVFPDHKTAISLVLKTLNELDISIDGIGHRIVQGGWYFDDSVIVDDDAMAKILEVAPLAPLHNYCEAEAIDYCRSAFPELPNVAVFDTSFHMTIPECAHTYALPKDIREKFHIRKYGAHGTSHRYEWMRAHEILGDKVHRLLSCHLGNGCSLAAIVDGYCMDTTMGLTPLDGLMMGTRCGSIDPATVCYLQREGGYTYDEVDDIMNKRSGFLAMSELTNDVRVIRDRATEGDPKCLMAFDMFGYRLVTMAGAMIAGMGGLDTISFAAGIGENDPTTRKAFCDMFEWFGVHIDLARNEIRSDEPRIISTDDSPIRVMVIPTDEEYMIALDVKRLVEAR
ncbi:acetate kinase [Coriobacterium glomerans PW2]|uniref:Acetate kinase n=1 Tax=Coriobacterium glomerans (strain ATCC 49209 / DSM 20642 / JCM 10262 / PW2) TaxID=700015 RepID=F2NBP6_CORGP|nr:acetate kinase [Coriobacterium glomerans]AEB06855.1 acetate kinase [Coriobacterium glomerans PW2]